MPPGWGALRARVLREEPTCRRCGRASTEVDHIVPRAEGGGHDRANLQGLCAVHHREKSAAEARRGRGRPHEVQ